MLVGAGGVHSAFIGVTHWIVLYGAAWLPVLYFYAFVPALICLVILLRRRRRRPAKARPANATMMRQAAQLDGPAGV